MKMGILTTAIATAYFASQSKRIVTGEYIIKDKKIPQEFDGFKIVQISDFHNAHFGKDNIRLLAKIKELNPDIVIVTGDAITHKKDIPNVIKCFKEIKRNYPMYYVSGNHEFMCNGYEIFTEEMKSFGVHIMDNRKESIVYNNAEIIIAGIKDPYGYDKEKRTQYFEKSFSKVKGDIGKFKILLAHQPQFFPYYIKNHWNLVFSGHAHGGQWRFADKSIYAPGQGLFPPYASGMHKLNGTSMIVSRGLGWTTCCLRLNNPAEIVLTTLKKI